MARQMLSIWTTWTHKPLTEQKVSYRVVPEGVQKGCGEICVIFGYTIVWTNYIMIHHILTQTINIIAKVKHQISTRVLSNISCPVIWIIL